MKYSKTNIKSKNVWSDDDMIELLDWLSKQKAESDWLLKEPIEYGFLVSGELKSNSELLQLFIHHKLTDK